MKKILTAILSLALLGTIAIPALAADPEPPEIIAPTSGEALTAPGFAIEVNGSNIDARACVMVPLRSVAEKLGFTVTWNSGTVIVTGSERYAELSIGVDQYFAAPTQEGMAGASLFSLGCAPVLMNSVTYVPVELFDALLGCREGTVTLEDGRVKINTEPGSEEAVQIPSPFTGHATLAEAAKAAGFELTVPEKVNGSPRQDIETMSGKMIQVFYGDDENKICIRKAAGSGDISGDYNQYAQVKVENGVAMKGENGLFMVAIWERGGYTYAITAGTGMSAAAMTALIQSVN